MGQINQQGSLDQFRKIERCTAAHQTFYIGKTLTRVLANMGMLVQVGTACAPKLERVVEQSFLTKDTLIIF